jgi:hypothetical protein
MRRDLTSKNHQVTEKQGWLCWWILRYRKGAKYRYLRPKIDVSISVADPDHVFHCDTDPDPTVSSGSGSLPFQRGNVHKTVPTFSYIFTSFSLSVGPTGLTQMYSLLNSPFQLILLCSRE